MEALTVSVTDQSRVSVSSAEEAVAAALRLTDGIRLLGQTHFRGLPGDADIKQAFEQMVIALSN